MAWRVLSVAVRYASLLLGVACSDGSGASRDGGAGATEPDSGADGSGGTLGAAIQGGDSLPMQQLATRAAPIVCAQAWECCTDEERAAKPLVGNTRESCTTNYADYYEALALRIAAAQEQGRLHYDPVAVMHCMNQLQASSCADYGDPECSAGIVPLVSVGQACTQDTECIQSVCIGGNVDSEAPVDGVCTALLALGAPCDEHRDCDSGRCAETCVEKQSAGAACSAGAECVGGTCDFSDASRSVGVCSANPSMCTL